MATAPSDFSAMVVSPPSLLPTEGLLSMSAPNTPVYHFHHAIHVGARSPRLLAMLEQLYAQVTHFRNLTLRLPGRAAVSAAGHAEILRAIQARDADSAEALMRGHIDDARHALLRHMDEIENQPEEAT